MFTVMQSPEDAQSNPHSRQALQPSLKDHDIATGHHLSVTRPRSS